ncbi:11474_t:CDS:2, partial [Funneliformis geosporum]
DIAEYYLKEYERLKGFVINCYRVEYYKNPLSDYEKARNNPKGTDNVHITFAYLEFNYTINADNIKFTLSFRKFDEAVMFEIEHAIVHEHSGMQSTQRVESINSVIHKTVVSSSIIFNVNEAIDIWMQKEALNKSFLAWNIQKDDEINITEEYYDFYQLYLNALLNSILRESIKKKVQVQYQVQKKMNYSRIIGYFKQVLNYSLDNDDENNLDDLILSYIVKKVEEYEAKDHSTIIEVFHPSNNTVKLHNERVYNVNNVKDPTICCGKGKPPNK